MSATVLIPAAGTGSRMGAGFNKQYLLLKSKPILAHTVSLFDRHPMVRAIYLISPRDEIELCRTEVVERYAFRKVEGVIEGGAERQDSVYNGLQACRAEEEEVVLIHDGVRPFFPPVLIESVISVAAKVGGCVVGMPVKDTIKEVAQGMIRHSPPRDRLWLAQTPQAFPFRVVQEAHQRARREGFRGTDDASLVERIGGEVAMVEGSYRNIKITTPEDLLIAKAFLAEEERQQCA